MAKLHYGGGKEPEKNKREEHYGGSRYKHTLRSHHHEPLLEEGRTTEKIHSRRVALQGGYHRPETKNYKWSDFVAYTGDHIGLIHIAALIPGRKKRSKR